jgi:hypothetical protein
MSGPCLCVWSSLDDVVREAEVSLGVDDGGEEEGSGRSEEDVMCSSTGFM